jgi:hypothetical protein
LPSATFGIILNKAFVAVSVRILQEARERFFKSRVAASAREAENDDDSGVINAAFAGDAAAPLPTHATGLTADADANENGNTVADEDANDFESEGVRGEEEEEEEVVETFRRPKYSMQVNREGSPGTIKFTAKIKPMLPSAASASPQVKIV